MAITLSTPISQFLRGESISSDLDVLGTLAADAATVGGNDALDASYFTPQTLTDAATITYDVASGVNAKVTITADRILDAIANAAAGQSGTLYIIQDGTGGWALTLDASQTDILGTLVDIAGMGPSETAVITWSTVDGTNFKFWISVDA